jgi:hypothetical protein
MVEPWLTPFLSLTHRFTDSPVARRFWSKLDALAEMISREQDTYQQWLGLPNTILGSILGRFDVELQKVAFGKILLRAKPMHEARFRQGSKPLYRAKEGLKI